MKNKLTELSQREKRTLAMLLLNAEVEDFDDEKTVANYRLACNLNFCKSQWIALLKIFKYKMQGESK